MSDVSRMFGEYLGAGASKAQELADSAAMKRAELDGYREGAQTDVGLTPDLTTDDLYAIGSAGDANVAATRGREDYMRDATADRSYLDAGKDTALDVINGVFQGVLGIGALGAGVVDADAGAAVAGAGQDLGQWIGDRQSDALADRRRANDLRNELTSEENARLRVEEEAQGDNPVLAGLRQIGRDFLDTASNLDGMTFQSGSAQGLGSLLVGGVIGKGIKAAGGAVAARAAVSQAGPSKAAFLINQVTQKGAMPAAIGALEGGGAYTQTVNEVMAISHDRLMKSSPDYRQLIEDGWDPDDAKAEVANHAGLTAAAIQVPVGLATGAMVSKFEANPLKMTGIRTAAGDILKETIEEGIQSGSGQLATNVGIQTFADEDRSLTQDVGGQIAEGAAFGLGMTGGIKAPTVPGGVVKAGADAISSGVKAGIAAFDTLGEAVNKSIESESPLSLNNVRETAEQAATNLSQPGVLDGLKARLATVKDSDTELSDGEQAIDRLIQAVSFDGAAEAELYKEGPAIAGILQGSTDRFNALDKMSQAVADKSLAPEDRAEAGLWLMRFTNDHAEDMVARLQDAFAPLDDNDPAVDDLNKLARVVANFGSSPEVVRAIEIGRKITSQLTAERVERDTRWAKIAAKAAVEAPDTVKPEVLDKVLEMASQGELPLEPAEIRSLQAVAALREVQQVDNDRSSELQLTKSHAIAYDIRHGDNDIGDFESLGTHQREVAAAVRQGDLQRASAKLRDLALFAQHMNNKVAATNANLAAGNGSKENTTPYQALGQQTRKFFEQKEGMWVNPIAPGSVRFSQRVFEDARAAVNLTNKLIELYPELGVTPVELVELDASLQQSADRVRQEYKRRAREANQSAPLAQERSTPAPATQEIRPDEQPASPIQATEAAQPGVEGEKAPVERQRDGEALQPETGGDAAGDKTIEPDTSKVEEKSEDVDNTAEKEVESSTRAGDNVEDNDAQPAGDIEPARLKTVAELYPDLYGAELQTNKFLSSFRVPGSPISRLLGRGKDLLNQVYAALASNKALREFVGEDNRFFQKPVDQEVLDNYRRYVRLAAPMMVAMTEQLQAFVGKNGERIAKGDPVNSWINGRALNIAERQDDGSYAYNPELLQGAVTAGLHWMLIANSSARNLDREDIARRFGMDIGDVPSGAEAYFNAGFPNVTSKRQLAQLIRRFWGVKETDDALIGNSEGILEAIAGEVLGAMTDPRVGLLKQDDPFTMGTVTVQRLLPVKDSKPGELVELLKSTRADMLEKMAMIEPDQVLFIGEAPTNVATYQMGSSMVRTTRQQKAVIERYQQVPFRANLRMVELYEKMTEEQFVSLFGADEYDPATTNINHAKSLDGQRITAQSAYSTFKELLGHIRQKANEDGVSPDQVEVFYEYGVSAVGRLHMLGRNNPQASKILREIILPTHASVDLADAGQRQMFLAAVAQHWGIKIHQTGLANIEQLVTDKAKELAQSIDLMSGSKSAFSDDELAIFKSEFGGDWGPGALHALQDYVRFTQHDDNSPFETALYLEADGITDGPINAMVHMGAGATGTFSSQWVKTVAKGGLMFGSKSSFAEQFARDPIDLYTAVKDELARNLENNLKTMAGHPSFGPLNEGLRTVMATLLKDMELGADGTLTIKRGLTKNPVTVTVYGSGAKGIANKIVSELLDEIYERMSNPKGQAELGAIAPIITGLTQHRIKKEDGKLVLKQAPAESSRERGYANFTFTSAQRKNFENIMLHLFVNPMIAAIDSEIGETRLAVEAMRDAVQIQSIFLKYAFQEDLASMIDANEAEGERRYDLFTRRQVQQARDRLKHMAPYIHTGTQSFFIAGSDKVDLRDPKKVRAAAVKGKDTRGPQFGSDFAENFRSSAYVEGPINAGVKAAPVMVIGPGDGQMIQFYAVDPASPDGLPVFDGYNLSVTDAVKGSERMNKAVFDGWMLNPLQKVAESFSEFVANVDLSDLSEEMLGELSRVLSEGNDFSPEGVAGMIKTRSEQLTELALQQQARKNVLARASLSVDHMAGAETPFVQDGEITFPSRDPSEIADILNREYDIELAKLRNAKTSGVSEVIAEELSTLGELNETSGARTAGMTEVRRMARTLSIPREQKALLDATLKQLADSDYTLTTGTLEQINADRIANSLSPLPAGTGKTTHGYTLAAEKRVYLINPSSETLTHELIHAATFDKVWAYYHDRSGLSPEQVAAVERIEQLMKVWINDALEQGERIASPELQQAYRDALRAVNGHIAKGNMAAALNEFMAWNLANNELIQANKRLSIVGTLAEISKQVLEALKTLIWGKQASRLAPAVANDLYSNLRFNTEVLMNSALTVEPVIEAGHAVLEHAVGSSNTERLKKIRNDFGRKIGQQVTAAASPDEKANRKEETMLQLANAIEVVDIMRADFPMSPLEGATFRNIVLALMTEAQLNPNALVRVQQIYSSTMKTLTVESFLADPDTATDEDRYYAQRKLNALLGLHGTRMDSRNRSTLMASFLGLSMVNEELRSILQKLPLPVSEKNKEGTLDALLENLGTEAMDRASLLFSGEGRRAPSIQAAIDMLQEKLVEGSVNDAKYVDQFINKVGETSDTFNDFVVDGIKNVSASLYDKLNDTEKATRNRLIESLAKYSKAIISIVNEDKAEIVAEGITSALNQKEVFTPLRELWSEIAGRTKSNKTIYDMIKAVRTFVQQTRQQFREHLPQLIEKHFSRKLTDDEWTAMFKGIAKVDLMSLATSMPVSRVLSFLAQPTAVAAEISRLENRLTSLNPAMAAKWLAKSDQLADYMVRGYPGRNLLRNAAAIARLPGELTKVEQQKLGIPPARIEETIDQLVSLYALQRSDPAVLDQLKTLATDEQEGMTYVLSYLVGLRKGEMAKVSGLATMNYFKGYVTTEQEAGASLIVRSDDEFTELRKRGYVRLGAYQGSNAERRSAPRSYYYAPVSGRAMFMQGIMQNVRVAAYGVDPRTGIANGPQTAGAITNLGLVDDRLLRNQGGEPLMPIYDNNGDVIGYERSMDPLMASKLSFNTQMHEVLGIWQGRQAEETMAGRFNQDLIARLGDQWRQERRTKRSEYVNLLSQEAQKDPILKDAVSLLTGDARDMIEEEFGKGQFWVRRDMINDALGYRSPSVSDLWTGISRWSPETQRTAQNVAMAIFGKDAFTKLIKVEQAYQTFVADAKVTIVVKSVVVPIANIMSNVYHLAGRGVPLKAIVQGFPAKSAEVTAFIQNRLRRMELQAQLRAAEGANNLSAQHRIKAEIKSILDANRRLSIWPLIEAGEFASISDAGLSQEEIQLTEGRLGAYIEKLTDKLPDGLKTAAKYGLVSRDTALFKGLQRAVEYGDFLAKAVLYEDLIGRKKMDKAEALGRVTEEFVNYDRQPGRWRSGLENNGLMWFWNFKLRSAKIALSVLRNNPLHLFLAHLAPTPAFLGIDVGTPVSDNFVSVIADNKEGYSLGLDQGLRAHLLNPWVNLFS